MAVGISMSEAAAGTFTRFPSLPAELRLLVWLHALEPRIIPLQCQIQCAPNRPGTFLYHSFLEPARDGRGARPASAIDIRVHFSAARAIAPVPALQVCRESRCVAVQHGYRAWPLRDEFGNTRDVMWSARLDTVSLATPYRPLIPRFYGELLRRQFPREAARVRRLAVPVESWHPKHRERGEVAACWAGYACLETMVVVLAGALKGEGAATLLDRGTCRDLAEMVRGLHALVARWPEKRWKAPDVVLVRGETSILQAEEKEMLVDCDSCSMGLEGCPVVAVRHVSA